MENEIGPSAANRMFCLRLSMQNGCSRAIGAPYNLGHAGNVWHRLQNILCGVLANRDHMILPAENTHG